jgi:hypothetical protein
MKTTIIGTFDDLPHAEMTIQDLIKIGVKDADISYLYSSEGRVVQEGVGKSKAGKGAASGAGAGAAVGAIAGLVVANGILPGLGSLFVAGPLAGALGLTGAAATTAAGAITGAATGTLLGALLGLGLVEADAKLYEERVRMGHVLVTASSDKPGEVKDAFMKNGANEVREYPAK